MFSRSALLISLVLILALVTGIYFVSGATFGASQFDASKVVFFSSENCNECQITQGWLEDKKIAQKMSLEYRMVNTSIAQAELQQAADYCKLPISQGIPMPLLFIEGKCYQSALEIQDFFKLKLNLAD